MVYAYRACVQSGGSQLIRGGFKLTPPLTLVGYADSNFADDPKDHKSLVGYCFVMGGALVPWSSKKQRTVSTSTTEAKYVTLGHALRERVWIRRYEMALENGDNESSLLLTKNPKVQNRTKYIDVQHHYIQEHIDEKELVVACGRWIHKGSQNRHFQKTPIIA